MASLVEKNIQSILSGINQTVSVSEYAAKKGLFQVLDPRAKIAIALILLLTISKSTSTGAIVYVYVGVLCLAMASRIPVIRLLKLWYVLPFFSVPLALPLIFSIVTPGSAVIRISPNVYISYEGVEIAVRLLFRVIAGITIAQVVMFTTRWDYLLKALGSFFVPKAIVFSISLTFRYIHILMRSGLDMLIAKKSRTVGGESARVERAWIGAMTGTLLSKTMYLSQGVHEAMISRGFTGTICTYTEYGLSSRDIIAVILAVIVSFLALFGI